MFIHASTGNCSDKILDLKGKTDNSFVNMEKINIRFPVSYSITRYTLFYLEIVCKACMRV